MSSNPSSPEPGSPGSVSSKENHGSSRRSGGNSSAAAAKRKRTLTNGAGRTQARRRIAEPHGADDDDETTIGQDDHYDPDQPLEERRRVQRGLRDLSKELKDHGEEYQQADSAGLHEILRRANELSANVKQTTEATIDAKLLVSTVDASYRRTVRLTEGNIAQGLDPDEFLAKCIGYMRSGAGIADDNATELTSTQHQRRTSGRGAASQRLNEEDDNGDEGDMANWEHLGRFACLPHIRRPATTGFLLGPLSVEKKVRKITKRSAAFRPGNLTETRPQVINPEDVQRQEQNDLTAICAKILKQLEQVVQEAQDAVESAYEAGGDYAELMRKTGLRSTGGIDLFKFVINPRSFGQTVENLFYVSFLIRDGKVVVGFDDDGLASLQPYETSEDEPDAETRSRRAQKHQAVLTIDMDTWRDIIDAFAITESTIPHRQEQSTQGPGARGWYS